MPNAKIIIDWDDKKGIVSSVGIYCNKKMKGTLLRILIGQLEIIKESLVKALEREETSEINIKEENK